VFSLKSSKQPELEPAWESHLQDYVTALVYSPTGRQLAASSAAGEIYLYPEQGERLRLLDVDGTSVDGLAFSADGQFLAASGQRGQVWIWHVGQPLAQSSEPPPLLAQLDHAPTWVDRLVWSPNQNLLAFSLGKYVQVWDANRAEIATTLAFETSSVLDITWHPDGQRLTVAGYQGVKVWNSQDWDDDPYLLDIPSASVAVAWSPDGQYLAAGNLDRTITVLAWENPTPWVMRGFPGKIRRLGWSRVAGKAGAAVLAAASVEGVVIWEKAKDPAVGWEGNVLEGHFDNVQDIRFHPQSLLLASAGRDGLVYLWQKARQAVQSLAGAPEGFSSLAWHPQGLYLAAGGQGGEIMVWSKRGKGFGK
jgi:WD40 repeat protein